MCAYVLRVPLREKMGSYLLFFSCIHVCIVRIGLFNVSVICETESLLEQFFHALWTLCTANCTLFSTVMVEFFDIKANI